MPPVDAENGWTRTVTDPLAENMPMFPSAGVAVATATAAKERSVQFMGFLSGLR